MTSKIERREYYLFPSRSTNMKENYNIFFFLSHFEIYSEIKRVLNQLYINLKRKDLENILTFIVTNMSCDAVVELLHA